MVNHIVSYQYFRLEYLSFFLSNLHYTILSFIYSFKNKLLNILSNTFTTIEFPACLYSCVSLVGIAFTFVKSESSNPINRQHSRGVNFLILIRCLPSSEINVAGEFLLIDISIEFVSLLLFSAILGLN